MILKKIYLIIIKRLKSPEDWARYIGVKVGKYNLMGKNHWSSEPYLITVGNHCQLTNCQIFTHGGGNVIRSQYPDFDAFGKVVIGDWVYIGSNALIMPGVTIEDHVLVAAGSVVTKSIPAGSIVAGNPAKIIGTTDDYIKRNINYNLRTKKLRPGEKKEYLLKLEDNKFIKKGFLKTNE